MTDIVSRDPVSNREALEAVAALPELTEGWRKLARRRMETGIVEDWSQRLNGPHP